METGGAFPCSAVWFLNVVHPHVMIRDEAVREKRDVLEYTEGRDIHNISRHYHLHIDILEARHNPLTILSRLQARNPSRALAEQDESGCHPR